MHRTIAALAGGILTVTLCRSDPTVAPPRREIAVTIDDLPAVSLEPGFAAHRAITQALLAKITAAGVSAIGFVNEGKLVRDGRRREDEVGLLRAWLDAGLELGNHTYSHQSLNRIPLEEFEADVVRGEQTTAELLRARGKKLRFFRHPFLQTGRELVKRCAFEEFLAARGYRVAPVTIDNGDWIFARAYDRARQRGDKAAARRVAAAYVPYMESKLDFFERESRQLFGREIRQILLIHANSINADLFSDLAAMMVRRGYAFVPLERALGDDAYRSTDTFTGAAGISWLQRWAFTRGVDREFFAGEPGVPAEIMKEAGVESE